MMQASSCLTLRAATVVRSIGGGPQRYRIRLGIAWLHRHRCRPPPFAAAASAAGEAGPQLERCDPCEALKEAEELEHFFEGEAMSLIYALRACGMEKREAEAPALQVVEIGGACARRPTGLHLPEDVRWFSVNFPEQASLKAERMAVATQTGEWPGPATGASYTSVHCHWLKGDLLESLKDGGWDPGLPTVWLCGPVLRTCDGRAAEVLMRSVACGARFSPCSALLALPGQAAPLKHLPAWLSQHGWRRVQTLEAPGDAGQAVTAFGGAELEKHLGTLEASA